MWAIAGTADTATAIDQISIDNLTTGLYINYAAVGNVSAAANAIGAAALIANWVILAAAPTSASLVAPVSATAGSWSGLIMAAKPPTTGVLNLNTGAITLASNIAVTTSVPVVVLSLNGFYNYYSLQDPLVDSFYYVKSGDALLTVTTTTVTITVASATGTVDL